MKIIHTILFSFFVINIFGQDKIASDTDRFSIHGAKFRIRNVENDSYLGWIVEAYKDGKWEKNLQFEKFGTSDDYDRTQDLNGDGYKDFILYRKWYSEVYFFNPREKMFFSTLNCYLNNWTLLDTARKIFCELEPRAHTTSLIDSTYSFLYAFKKFKRIDLFKLKIFFTSEDGIIKKEILYSAKNEKIKIEEIVPKREIDTEEFDYEKFWKQRYKKLLDYK